MHQPSVSADRGRPRRKPWIAISLLLGGCNDVTVVQPGDIRFYSVPKSATEVEDAAPAAPAGHENPPEAAPAPEAGN